MIRKTNNYNDYSDEDSDQLPWDGLDRRRHRRGVDRLNEEYVEYLQQQCINRIDQGIAQQIKSEQPSSFKLFSSGTALSVCFSILTAVSGFVFGLYKQVTALEYRQQTIFEKLDDTKQEFIELKSSIKEAEGKRLKLADHVSSIEETIMELYRNQQKK